MGKNIIKSLCIVLGIMFLSACTNLDETIYDQVESNNFYNTRKDVERVVARPFEHCYHMLQFRHFLQELPSDQIISPSRDGWWDDGGRWRRYHYHTWTAEDDYFEFLWNSGFEGIGQCNFGIEELEKIDKAKFNFTQEEIDGYIASLRVLRAFCYLSLLDGFRNIPYVVSFEDQTKNTEGQVEPQVIFNFIETELSTLIPKLPKKKALGTSSEFLSKWTQAGAAALLARLYLNAEVYVGSERYTDCAKLCQDILDGVYGTYEVANRWDAAFDWDNNTCDEVIFAFPNYPGGNEYWNYHANTYWWTVPANAHLYLKDQKCKAGGHNTKYAAAPSYDLTGKLYTDELGMPIQKFRKYPGDERMKLYKNLGNGKREGLFLYGYLEYTDDNGKVKKVRAPERDYDLYIRDAVGDFQNLDPELWPSNKTSSMTTGDHNSGWHYVKYPMYSDDDPHQLEAAYAEIRLPEIIYMLAECKLRSGNTPDAAALLNSVRRRNYPVENLSEVLYEPEGSAKLDMQEMLDEWGREFFAETRRRTDLVRYGKFSSGKWWDKTPDVDNHTDIFPIPFKALQANPHLVQNKGY